MYERIDLPPDSPIMGLRIQKDIDDSENIELIDLNQQRALSGCFWFTKPIQAYGRRKPIRQYALCQTGKRKSRKNGGNRKA